MNDEHVAPAEHDGCSRADAVGPIDWPDRITFTISSRERHDLFEKSVTPEKPVRVWQRVVAWIIVAYGASSAVHGIGGHERHHLDHEMMYVLVAFRASLKLVQHQLFRRQARRARNVAALSRLGGPTTTVAFDDDGLHVTGDGDRFVAWTEVQSITHRDPYFIVDVPSAEPLAIPCSAFADGGRRFADATEAKFFKPSYLLIMPTQPSSTIRNARYEGPT